MLPRHLLVCACLVPAACTGPATILRNPDAHRVFVDGAEVAAADEHGQQLPFRYYGISRWDAMPADRAGQPDWSQQPSSAPIELTPPVSQWLFPLDFPLELGQRLVAGRRDFEVPIVLPPTPAGMQIPAEVPPTGLGQLVDRAKAARIAR